MRKILFLVLLACACTGENTGQVSDELLTPEEFKEKISAASVLVDVRTPGEYAQGYIPGAVNIDFRSPDFEQRLDSLDKSRTYLLYCAAGSRSSKAADLMKSKGFGSVLTLEGGLEAWSGSGFTLE